MHWLYIAPLLVIVTLALASFAIAFVRYVCWEIDRRRARRFMLKYDPWGES
jgi:hypothetical protein